VIEVVMALSCPQSLSNDSPKTDIYQMIVLPASIESMMGRTAKTASVRLKSGKSRSATNGGYREGEEARQ
jgi:hypothetical protein